MLTNEFFYYHDFAVLGVRSLLCSVALCGDIFFRLRIYDGCSIGFAIRTAIVSFEFFYLYLIDDCCSRYCLASVGSAASVGKVFFRFKIYRWVSN